MPRSSTIPLFPVVISVLIAAAITGCAPAEPELAGKPLSAWEQQLTSTGRHDRLSAIRAIGAATLEPPQQARAVPILEQATTHEDRAVRYWALRALGGIQPLPTSAAERMQEALNDNAPEVRIWAAHALCKTGNLEAGLPILIQELGGTSGPARLHAAHALEDLGDQARPAVEALQARQGDAFGYPDRVATRVLTKLGKSPPGT